jgi:hypothetical protein
MTDLVIPLGTGSKWKNNELRYALRSYAKYFKDLGDVYIVGDRNYINNLKWLTNVIVVNCDDPFNRNKDGNIIRKVLRVIEKYPKLTDNFVRASDDQLLWDEVDSMPPLYIYNLKDKEQAWWMRGNRWKVRLKKTMRILEVKKKTTWNYDSHIPMTVNKHKFKEVWSKFPWQKSIGYCINTLYFNMALDKHQHYENKKISVEAPVSDSDVLAAQIKGKKYLGYNDKGLNDVLKEAIQQRFPDPCRFEAEYKGETLKKEEDIRSEPEIFEDMTKKEIIEKCGLDPKDIRLTKKKLIEKCGVLSV